MPTNAATEPGNNPFNELARMWTSSQTSARAALAEQPMLRDFLRQVMTFAPMAFGPRSTAGGQLPPRFTPATEPLSTQVQRLGPTNPEGFPGTFGGRRVTMFRDADLLRRVENVPFPHRTGDFLGQHIPRQNAAPGGPVPLIGTNRPGLDVPQPGRVFTPREDRRFLTESQRMDVLPLHRGPRPEAEPTGNVIPFRRPGAANDNTPGGATPPDTSRSHVGQLARLSEAQFSLYMDMRSRGVSAQEALAAVIDSPPL